MEHDHECERLADIPTGDIQLVGACAVDIGIEPVDKVTRGHE
jgi:hypothetical protein